MSENLILKISNVSKKFPGNVQALDDVSFSIFQKEFIVIAGANGSGKSVLMSLIAKLDEPTSGTVQVFGETAGLVFQDADSQILGETLFEDVSFGVKNSGVKKSDINLCVENSLSQVSLFHKKDFLSRSLSGGEKRRLAVAGILAMNRDFLIFDEPFANLDYPSVKNVCNILKQLKGEGKTIIVLTHEIEKILALADRFMVLKNGKIVFDGTPSLALEQNLEEWDIRKPSGNLEDFLWS